MSKIAVILALLIFSTSADAQIYKWRDENGKLHFSDTPPVTQEAVKKFTVKDNVAKGIPVAVNEKTIPEPIKIPTAELPKVDVKKTISARDYTISKSIETKNNYVVISGRIGKGPPCENLRIEAFAVNENGRRAHVTDITSLNSSHGSTLYEGKDRVFLGKDDSDWEITSFYVTCRD